MDFDENLIKLFILNLFLKFIIPFIFIFLTPSFLNVAIPFRNQDIIKTFLTIHTEKPLKSKANNIEV